MGIFDKFKTGLYKSSKNLSSGLNDLFFKKKIDEETLNKLEDFLILSDVGVESSKDLREKFSNTKLNPEKSHKDEIFKILASYISEILKPLEKKLEDISYGRIIKFNEKELSKTLKLNENKLCLLTNKDNIISLGKFEDNYFKPKKVFI